MKTPTRIVAVGVGLVVLLAAGGEFGARWYANQETQQRVPASVENPRLSFPIPSLLIDAADRTISHVTFSAEGEVPLEADIKDLDISDSANPIAGQLVATVHLSDTYLLAAIQQQQESRGFSGLLGDLTRVTKYSSSAATGTSTVSFGNNTGSLDIRPSASGGEFHVASTELTVGGLTVGNTIEDLIASAITSILNENLQNFTVTFVEVGDGITTVTVTAQGINLNQSLTSDVLSTSHI